MSARANYSVMATNDERGEWAEPEEMNATYALLYNTLDVNGVPYLPTQMDSDVWRLVYGPPIRSRQRCWSESTGERTFTYMQRRIVKENEPLKRYRFPPPERTFDRSTGRSFEIQIDGYLCGVHSFNNLANSVILAPPDILSTIELLRPLYSRFAAVEELILCALREGVFLLPIKLDDASDLNPLDPSEPWPTYKCFLNLVEKARGMLIINPSPGTANGHFASLVYAEPEEGGLDPELRWLVYSSTDVVTRGTTAASALDRYILLLLKDGLNSDEKTREERRRQLAQANGEPVQFVGLLPLSLRLLREDALSTAQEAPAPDANPAQLIADYTELVLLRTLVRRSLSVMRVVNAIDVAADQQTDIDMPTPMSPNAFDEICWLVKNNTTISASGAPVGIFDGNDQTNVASFCATKHSIDVQINRDTDSLARLLVREFESRWTADALVPLDPLQATTGVLVAVDDRYREMRFALIQVRRAIHDPTQTIGLLQTGSGTRGESFDKFSRLLSNRRWLRYIILSLTASALIEELTKAIDRKNFPLSLPVRRILFLFCSVAFVNQQGFGIRISSTPSIIELFGVLQRDRESLPLDSLPTRLTVVRTSPITEQSELAQLFVDGNYEWNLWLLQAAVDAGIGTIRLPSLHPLEIQEQASSGSVYDDGTHEYDMLARFVTLLRTTLFRLPMPDADYSVIADRYAAQSPFTATRRAIAEHFYVCGSEFVTQALATGMVANRDEALGWIDVLAFHSGFANDQTWQNVARNVATHELDDTRPRFVERAAQTGYDIYRRRIFGRLQLAADNRAPITNNIDRIPLPAQPGNWRSTRPRVLPETTLCVRRLSELALYADTRYRSINAARTDGGDTKRVKRSLAAAALKNKN